MHAFNTKQSEIHKANLLDIFIKLKERKVDEKQTKQKVRSNKFNKYIAVEAKKVKMQS
jgi:hypothetical protein